MAEFRVRWIGDHPQPFTVVSECNGVAEYYPCRAPFGDFLHAYLAHVSLPWWRRFWWAKEWREVGDRMREILNEQYEVNWAEREH